MVNVSTSLNNSKSKVDDLDVGKLKFVPVDLKKSSDLEDDEVVKIAKFNTLKIKIPDATALIHINQHNTNKENLEKKKMETLIKNTRYK